MNVQCNRGTLASALKTVTRAVAGRTTLPILNNVLVVASSEGLTLTGYDMEMGIEQKMPATVVQEGAMTLPARMFAEIVTALDAAEVSITVDERAHVVIRCGGAEYVLNALPPEEFPTLPPMESVVSLTVGREDLVGMLEKTVFAVAKDVSRPVLQGVLFSFDSSSMTAVATDMHRLSWRTSRRDEELIESASLLLPGHACIALARVLSANNDETVVVEFGENQVAMVLGQARAQVRLLEGDFPNWQRVVPDGTGKTTVVVNREELVTGIKRSAMVAREAANKVIVDVAAMGLTLSADSHEVGTATVSVMAQVSGEPMKVGFNSTYFAEGLAAMDSEDVQLVANGSELPVLITPVGQDNYKYVLMPMQTG